VSKPKGKTIRDPEEALFADLAPAQVVALDDFLATIRLTGRCVIVTDLHEMLTVFSGGLLKEDTVTVLADYLGVGGILVFSTDTAFDWFYARLLRPLIVKLGARSQLLASVLLIVSNGAEIFVFEDGAYRRVSVASRDSSGGFDLLEGLLRERRLPATRSFDRTSAAYIADSRAARRIDHAMAGRVGRVIDVGDATLAASDKPITGLHREYHRAIDVIVAATRALQESGLAGLPPDQPDAGDTVLWTFDRPKFPKGRRLCVRVKGSGFVHAGVSDANGVWNPIYNVPLVPLPEGGYEAVLPAGVNAFTFFWTEIPHTPGHPGHWERGPYNTGVFRAHGV
jgi:hypothetical protein